MEKLLGEQLLKHIADPSAVTEVRLRAGRKTMIKTYKKEYLCEHIATEGYLKEVVMRAVKFSPYAYETEVSSGFIPYAGGIRIGVAGKGKLSSDNKIAFSEILSLCVRIPHEIIGASNVLGDFYTVPKNIVVIAPPYCGKTTLIRDMARVLSERYDTLYIDERGELSAGGVLTVEKHADIILGIPKKYLYENVIRAMAPKVVVCDELFSPEDIYAVKRLCGAGIKCLASYHAPSAKPIPEDIKEIFDQYVVLTDKPRIGTVSARGCFRD